MKLITNSSDMPSPYPEPANVKSVLTGYIREAQTLLNPDKFPEETAVHDIRVLMKKSRATLKLIKGIIGEEAFRREYSALREVGRIMSTWRETSVLRKLLKDLKKKHPEAFTGMGENKKIISLLTHQKTSEAPDISIKKDIIKIIDLLHRSEYRLRFLNADFENIMTLLTPLDESFNMVLSAYLKARIRPGSKNVHFFRKRVKDFLYQLFYFRSLNPKQIKILEKKLEMSGQSLGKFNDLAVLVKTIGLKYDKAIIPSVNDRLIVIIRSEQDRYLRKLWLQADSIFYPGRKLSDLKGFGNPDQVKII